MTVWSWGETCGGRRSAPICSANKSSQTSFQVVPKLLQLPLATFLTVSEVCACHYDLLLWFPLVWFLTYCNKHVMGEAKCVAHLGKKEHYGKLWQTMQICQLCVVKSHRLSSFIKYSKLRHLHRKSTFEHMIQRGIICIKVPGIYSYASVFSVLLSVKWALIQSQIQCTVYISH